MRCLETERQRGRGVVSPSQSYDNPQRALAWLSDGNALILLLVVVLLSRLPFLGAGYGLHWDAWAGHGLPPDLRLDGATPGPGALDQVQREQQIKALRPEIVNFDQAYAGAVI
jgi:hypothetical protein